MNTQNTFTTIRSYMFVGALSLLTCGFDYITAAEAEPSRPTSEDATRAQTQKTEAFLQREGYRQYFQEQQQIFQGILALGVSGARPLDIDETLAEKILETCPPIIQSIIQRIKLKKFLTNKKNIIFHGMSGTGKSCLSQAIAIKTQSPCLFVNAGDISNEYKDSGPQNLSRIFQYAKTLEETSNKSCVIIFDELEALTQKHTDKNNPEKSILMSFWQQLDALRSRKIIVIGTMNNKEDLPVTITNRTLMIKIETPKLEEREKILSYFLQKYQDQEQIIYSPEITAAKLAQKTDGFSNRDLENLVEEASEEAILAQNSNEKTVKKESFDKVIKEIKGCPQRQEERNGKTWTAFKKHLKDPHVILPAVSATCTVASVAISVISLRQARKTHKESMLQSQTLHATSQQQSQTFHKESLQQSQTLHKESLQQSKDIADYQNGGENITKHSLANLSVLGIPVGPIVTGTGYACVQGGKWIFKKFKS